MAENPQNTADSRDNTQNGASGRDAAGHWLGCGNPGGRKKSALMQCLIDLDGDPKFRAAAIARFRHFLVDKKVAGKDQLRAFEIYFDRLCGRPVQAIDLNTRDDNGAAQLNLARQLVATPGYHNFVAAVLNADTTTTNAVPDNA